MNKIDRIAPKTYCIKDRLGKSHTDHTAKMNFFLIIFVTCFVVASIQAHTVDIFGDVDGKKLVGHKMIFERAEKHGTIVRTVKFPEVLIEITISCMKNWFFEQESNWIYFDLFSFQSDEAFNCTVTGFKHIHSDGSHTKAELIAGYFGSKRVQVRLESSYREEIFSKLEFYGEDD